MPLTDFKAIHRKLFDDSKGRVRNVRFNGYSIKEKHEEDLADLVLSFVNKKINEDILASELRERATKTDS